MNADAACEFYRSFIDRLRSVHRSDLISDGRFGAMMRVEIDNDGPVTVVLDSRER